MKQHTKPSIPGSATVTDAMGTVTTTVTATTPADSIEGTTSDIAPGVISDANGYLLRNRPPQRWMDWSKVPVGRNASLQTSHGLSTRDLEIMRFAERFGMVTLEQITRVFFNSEDPASNAVMQLRKRRYLAKVEVPSTFLTEAVGRRPGIAKSVIYWLRFILNSRDES